MCVYITHIKKQECNNYDTQYLLPYCTLHLAERMIIIPNNLIVRIEKRSNNSAIGKIERHNERTKAFYKSNPDIRPERTHLNYHLRQPYFSYLELVNRRIEEVGVKRIRKDSIKMQDAIVTASPEWLARLALEQQREFFERAYNFFTNRYGKENFISAVVHMDEKTPHMHFTFVPITKDGRLSSKEIIGGPVGMSKLQNEFYDYMIEFYPDLDRGIPKRESNRKHLPTALFKEAADLVNETQALIEEVQKIGHLNINDTKNDVVHRLRVLNNKVSKIQNKLNSNENYINDLAKRDYEAKMTEKRLTSVINKTESDYRELNYEVNDLKEQLECYQEGSDRIVQQKDEVILYLQRILDKLPPSLIEQAEEKVNEEIQRQKRRNDLCR